MTKEISDEVDALLRFYKGRKLISVEHIKEFSRVYMIMQERMKDMIVFNQSNGDKP